MKIIKLTIITILLSLLTSCVTEKKAVHKYKGYVVTYKSWDYMIIYKGDSLVKVDNPYYLNNYSKGDTIKNHE